MPYQYVREPLTADEADRLANACESPTEQLIVWTLLDTGLRVGELCDLTTKDVLWQQRQLRVRGKGGPYGKKSKVRVVPMSRRVRALLLHDLADARALGGGVLAGIFDRVGHDRRLRLARPLPAPGLVQGIGVDRLQFGPRLGGGGAQLVDGVR